MWNMLLKLSERECTDEPCPSLVFPNIYFANLKPGIPSMAFRSSGIRPFASSSMSAIIESTANRSTSWHVLEVAHTRQWQRDAAVSFRSLLHMVRHANLLRMLGSCHVIIPVVIASEHVTFTLLNPALTKGKLPNDMLPENEKSTFGLGRGLNQSGL